MASTLSLKFWRALYGALLVGARPLVRLRLWHRGRREPEYRRRIGERFARLPAGLPSGVVWFHTVSAGETIAAAPLIRSLCDTFPDLDFMVTTMTPTGSAQVNRLLGDRVAHCYAPYDFADAVQAFFVRVRPRLLVLMETELWPNLLRTASAQGVPALLVNARLSARSAAGYARIAPLTRDMLASLKFIACQYPDHAERFLALGAEPTRVGVLGSVKFDVELPADHAERTEELRRNWQLADRPVWIAASTHAGEEEIVLQAHEQIRALFPKALLLLVPRHPERRAEVGALIRERGLSMAALSEGRPQPGVDVILGDTMGELLYLYGVADVAFIGGSLVGVGGHNPIEAAVCGRPLLMGPSTFNFPEVAARFADAGCLQRVSSAAELAGSVGRFLGDPDLRAETGAEAVRVTTANTGATRRLGQLLEAEIRSVVHPGESAADAGWET